MLSAREALSTILGAVNPSAPVPTPLREAAGRVLAEDLVSEEAVPRFTHSAMDGFAVRSEDVRENGAVLAVVETLPAGVSSRRRLRPGEAARIMTGAPVPDGADAVVPVEDADALPGAVLAPAGVEPGQHIRCAGEEIRAGETLLAAGRLLRPADIGLFATLGKTSVRAIPAPRVVVLTTGSEVVDSGSEAGPGQIRNANLPAVSAAAERAGARVLWGRHVADEPDALRRSLAGTGADAIITCGGVSAGDFDFVKQVLAELGEIAFWKVAIKPGKPFVFGRIGEAWVFGLPGNPVSALLAFELFVRPALRRMAGLPGDGMPRARGVLAAAVPHRAGREEYVRVRVGWTGSAWRAEPLPWQGSGMLRSLTEAGAWMVIPEDSSGLPAGAEVDLCFPDGWPAAGAPAAEPSFARPAC